MTPKKQRNIIIAIAIAAFLIYFGYENCWFGCTNAVLDLQWCPERCCFEGLDNDSNGASPSADTCPPINTKLYASTLGPDILAAEAFCRDGGFTWVDTSTELACRGDMGLDCGSAFLEPSVRALAVTCREQGGMFLCQDNYLGCYCPGTGNTIPGPSMCSKRVEYGHDTPLIIECSGPCESFEGAPAVACIESGSTCLCDYYVPT
jgi:hypothetical protein